MAEANNSIAAMIQSNARLKKNVEVAKKVEARKDYSGPPGDVVCKFTGKAVVAIQDNPAVILEFKVDGSVPGQEKHNGERIAIFNKFYDDDYGTVESRQAEMFERIQLMGIDTKKLTLAQIDAALLAARDLNVPFTIKVVSKPGKGKNAGKMFTNYFISGVVGDDEEPTSSEADDAATDEDEEAEGWSAEESAAAAGDDADAEGSDADDEDDNDGDDDLLPSDWIGDFEVGYRSGKSPKVQQYKVIAADDKKRTVTLQKGKTVLENVEYDKLILPD